MTFAPILISFSRRLVSDHGSSAFGIAGVRMKLPSLRRLRIFGQQDKLRADRSKGRETWA
jgi:hypothetical protein